MKTRLYDRNVIKGGVQYKELVKAIKHEYRTRVIVSIFGTILALIIAVISTILLNKYTNFAIVGVCFVPIIVTPAIREIAYLHFLKENLKALTLDKSKYSEWMVIQSRKTLSESDYQKSLELFEKYKSSYKENHKELIDILKNELKVKPAKPLTVSMLCGLIFLSGNREDHDLLFNARYRHGEAGNIIPEIWISVLSNDTEDFVTLHSNCSRDFLEYWEHLLKV